MTVSLLTARTPSMAGLVWPSTGLARTVILVLTGTILLALSAKLQVPFWPVPMTMQTLVVLVLGAAYGPRLGAATMLAYVGEGLAGLPVFAGVSAGPIYVMGPTGGYLLGFLVAAIAVGTLAERGWDRRLGLLIVAMCIGHALIFAGGMAWLTVLFGWSKAVTVGFMPFIWATVLKTAMSAALLRGLWVAIRRNRAA